MGLLNDPQVKNHIVLNIYDVDLKIKDVQILMDTYKQKIISSRGPHPVGQNIQQKDHPRKHHHPSG